MRIESIKCNIWYLAILKSLDYTGFKRVCVRPGYQPLQLDADGRIWLEEMGLFLGVWQGKKAEMTTNWLRWWDQDGNLLLWGQESLDLERQRLAEEKQKAEKLANKLRELGIDPDTF